MMLEIAVSTASAGPLPAGVTVPDLCLRSTDGEIVNLRDLRGKAVILAFCPYDWSPVCSDPLSLYNELLPEFQRLGAELFAISVDSGWCHLAFADDRRLRFPLLADFESKGQVARRYGVYRLTDGTCEPALFVIDGAGIVRWSYLSPAEINSGADGILPPWRPCRLRSVSDDDVKCGERRTSDRGCQVP